MSLTKNEVDATLRSISLGFGMKLGHEVLLRPFGNSEVRGFFVFVYAEDQPCNDTGEPLSWKGRKWYVSKHATKSELVLTAWKAYFTALEHEAREKFTFQGVRLFDPHLNVIHLAGAIAEGFIEQDRRAEPEAAIS